MANYWQDRAAASQAAITNKSIAETEEQIKKYYQQTQKKIIGQFEETYNHLLSSIADGHEPTPADLYKLDKYWQMESQVRAELTKLGYKEAELLGKKFNEQWEHIYRGIALKDDLYFGEIDTEAVKQMINQVWCADGQTWSNRVWNNVGNLQATLNDSLIDCVVAGRKTSELKKILQERFGVSYNQATTLVRTEMSHIQTQAARERYRNAGLTMVEVWADKDERRCDVCGELHQTKHNINGIMPIPAHPNCRCSILPVLD